MKEPSTNSMDKLAKSVEACRNFRQGRCLRGEGCPYGHTAGAPSRRGADAASTASSKGVEGVKVARGFFADGDFPELGGATPAKIEEPQSQLEQALPLTASPAASQ